MPQFNSEWLGTQSCNGGVRKAPLPARAVASHCHNPSGRMQRDRNKTYTPTYTHTHTYIHTHTHPRTHIHTRTHSRGLWQLLVFPAYKLLLSPVVRTGPLGQAKKQAQFRFLT